MMFSFIFLTFMSIQVFGNSTIKARISSIDHPIPPEDETLIFLDTGLVIKTRKAKDFLIKKTLSELSHHDYLFTFNQNRELIEMKSTQDRNTKVELLFINNFDYVPTTIESLALTRKYFREARYYDKESQCFNRAMVWTYEWWRRHSLRSNKILIFFTRNYIRRYNFEWWFHIAPLVNVMDEGDVKERFMDIKYSNGPLPLKSWTDLFMKGNPDCPMVERYSDYADHPYEGDCYLQRTHMYTYQPADLQMYEAWGYQKNEFALKEVQQAYREAMDEIVTIDEEGPGHEIF